MNTKSISLQLLCAALCATSIAPLKALEVKMDIDVNKITKSVAAIVVFCGTYSYLKSRKKTFNAIQEKYEIDAPKNIFEKIEKICNELIGCIRKKEFVVTKTLLEKDTNRPVEVPVVKEEDDSKGLGKVVKTLEELASIKEALLKILKLLPEDLVKTL